MEDIESVLFGLAAGIIGHKLSGSRLRVRHPSRVCFWGREGIFPIVIELEVSQRFQKPSHNPLESYHPFWGSCKREITLWIPNTRTHQASVREQGGGAFKR